MCSGSVKARGPFWNTLSFWKPVYIFLLYLSLLYLQASLYIALSCSTFSPCVILKAQLSVFIYTDLWVEPRQVAPDVKEVLDTFRVAAELGSDSLGAYVISMASNVQFYGQMLYLLYCSLLFFTFKVLLAYDFLMLTVVWNWNVVGKRCSSCGAHAERCSPCSQWRVRETMPWWNVSSYALYFWYLSAELLFLSCIYLILRIRWSVWFAISLITCAMNC